MTEHAGVVSLYGELCALRTSFAVVTDRGLANRLSLQSLRSAMSEIEDELKGLLRGLLPEPLADLLSAIQFGYGETARFELEDLLATPTQAMVH